MTEENSYSNLFCRTLKPAPVVGFSFLSTYGDKMGTRKDIIYRGPRLHTTGKKWFVEYSYRIPAELDPRCGWKRFRVYEDINRIKTLEYARILLRAVEIGLEEGYNPFDQDLKDFYMERGGKRDHWTISQALIFFQTKWEERGLERLTINAYKQAIKHFRGFLASRNLDSIKAAEITHEFVETYLETQSREMKWSNRTFNNQKNFLKTVFQFLKDKQVIPENPFTGIAKKKVLVKKHKYFDADTFRKVNDLMAKHDKVLHFAAKLVYYLCIRSEKELKLLKVGNIFLENRTILINAADSKTDRDRRIRIPDQLFTELEQIKKMNPPEYFVIGVSSKNKFVSENKPGPAPFGNGFLSKRFAKIREMAGLSSDYTLFGYRHSRAVHLKLDGAKDVDIMNMMGHTDFTTTAKYLRDIALAVDGEAVQKLTRDF